MKKLIRQLTFEGWFVVFAFGYIISQVIRYFIQ